MTGTVTVHGGNPVPVSLYPTENSRGMTRDRNQGSMVTRQRQIAGAMKCLGRVNVIIFRDFVLEEPSSNLGRNAKYLA